VETLERQVSACDVLLAVIGPNWAGVTDAGGKRRLEATNDFVRIEIASALRLGKHIIPVLVNEAQMPVPDQLPDSLKHLARRNAIRLTHERFRADAQGLVSGLRTVLTQVQTERAAKTEAERKRAEESRKKREAEAAARSTQLEKEVAERSKSG